MADQRVEREDSTRRAEDLFIFLYFSLYFFPSPERDVSIPVASQPSLCLCHLLKIPFRRCSSFGISLNFFSFDVLRVNGSFLEEADGGTQESGQWDKLSHSVITISTMYNNWGKETRVESSRRSHSIYALLSYRFVRIFYAGIDVSDNSVNNVKL